MLSGYRHAPGDHCGSASLRNLADFYEWGFSEPECFGLGAGIGFGYYDRGPASRMIMGRSAALESVFFDVLGIDVTHTDGQSREDAWASLEGRLDAGAPVLCFVDLYYLEYFDTDTHFGPHTVVVADVDDETVTVSDSEFPTPQTVDRDAFDAAWTSEYGFGPLDRRWLAVDDPTVTVDVADATLDAVDLAVDGMLHGDDDWGGDGVAAIRAFATELPEWTAFEDVQWTARFAYQNIERRGTGGGAFRRLYADFLETLGVEAGLTGGGDASAADADTGGGDASAADAKPGFDERMHAVAADWRTLADRLRDVSETDDTGARADLLGDAGDLAASIADEEESLYADLEGAVDRLTG